MDNLGRQPNSGLSLAVIEISESHKNKQFHGSPPVPSGTMPFIFCNGSPELRQICISILGFPHQSSTLASRCRRPAEELGLQCF
ncbi:hypothetical protein RRG08_005168 [Elysia crispata]|uniref:Uncharacterized protein n=1 Tax=Elysia crispata TaxID=231223 RepID=A0AAE0ZHX9_9GAST|nr:hypothetical protein RRG08_005168 [Elysia crispata]